MTQRFNNVIGIIFVSIAAVIWGSNGVIVNFIQADPFLIAFYRTLLATLILTPIAFIMKRSEFIKVAIEWRQLMLNGFINALGWGSYSLQ